MALVTCPECGKQISEKAPVCIHCGYPMQEQPPLAPTVARSKKVVIPSFAGEGVSPQKIPAIKVVREVLNMGLAEAKEFVEQPISYIVVKDGLHQDQAETIAQKFNNNGVEAKIYDSTVPVTVSATSGISCPRCRSKEYHAGARGYSLLTGFVGSGKTMLTCLKCGYRWKPGK